MKRRTRGMLAVAAASVTVVSGVAFAPAAIAAPADDSTPAAAQRLDNRPGPLTERQNERRKAAQKLILSGQASPGEDGVVQLADDKYYEASVTGTGRLFTILSEFGDQASGKLGSTPGPLHNEIPEPDRAVNNSTHWMADFDTGVLRGPLLRRRRVVRGLLHEAVGGRVHGRRRGERLGEGARQRVDLRRQRGRGLRRLVAVHRGLRQRLVRAQVAAGKTVDEIKAELASFDVWDRYDADGDGELRRARRLPRPLPGRARRRGRGRRRRRAGRGRDLVAPLVRELHRLRHDRPRGCEVRRRADRRHRHTGSATTPSRPRTAASACSRTSTRTTSACPTSTTRPAARTAPASGRSCRAARGSTRARTTSARPRTTWVRGRSSSSAGSTTRS